MEALTAPQVKSSLKFDLRPDESCPKDPCSLYAAGGSVNNLRLLFGLIKQASHLVISMEYWPAKGRTMVVPRCTMRTYTSGYLDLIATTSRGIGPLLDIRAPTLKQSTWPRGQVTRVKQVSVMRLSRANSGGPSNIRHGVIPIAANLTTGFDRLQVVAGRTF
jgi:hypothetical protein